MVILADRPCAFGWSVTNRLTELRAELSGLASRFGFLLATQAVRCDCSLTINDLVTVALCEKREQDLEDIPDFLRIFH